MNDAILKLRQQGYAVILFTPEELRGADPERVESRGVELINDVIEDIAPADDPDDAPVA